jgi:hypothetical protein
VVAGAPDSASSTSRPSTAPFAPALYDTFAIITRRAARLSPAVRELIADLEAHMQVAAARFDGSRPPAFTRHG